MSLKAVSSIHFITGSADTTPPSGYGSVYASSSFLFYKNDAGQEFNLTRGRTNILYYTGSITDNVYTYIKPTNLREVLFVAVGAGGGGGSGRVGATNTNRAGGTGGNGGNLVYASYLASELPDILSIYPGKGGNGGAAVPGTVAANGNVGSNGNASFVTNGAGTITYVLAYGGNGGINGQATSGVNSSQNNTLNFPVTTGAPMSFLGGQGAGSSTVNSFNTNGMFAGTVPSGVGGGTAGGSISATNTTTNPGNIITGNRGNNTTTSPATTAGAQGIDGTDNFNRMLLLGAIQNSSFGIGSAGGGSPSGGATNPVPCLRGGNGGNFGAGGGGGGANTVGFASGAGGRGGDGLIIVIEYY